MKILIQKYFILVMCMCCSMLLHAQITVSTMVVPPYQSRISEYASNPHLILLSVTNTSLTTQDIQLTGKITGDNGISAWVKPGFRSPRPLTLAPGQTITLNGTDISFMFDVNKIEYTGISRADMSRGLGLLEGNYTLCIRALDYKSLNPLSAEQMGCSSFKITDLEPPRILMPFDNQKVENKGVQAFPISWSTPPGSSPQTQYKVKIVEVIAPRNPNDAIQTTRPLVEETVQHNVMMYGPTHPALIPGRTYVMEVQAIDPTLKTKFRNNGKSAVSSFVYGSNDVNAPNINMEPSVKKMANNINAKPDCSCKINAGNLVGNLATDVKVGDIVKVNHFDMNVNAISSRGNGIYSGEGTITLPGLGGISGAKHVKLRVSFSEIKINKIGLNNTLADGLVIGRIKNDFSLIPEVDNPDLKTIPMDSKQVGQLDQYFKSNTQQLLSNISNSENSVGFELPLGIDKGSFTVGVTNVVFDAQQTWFDAVTVLNMTDAFSKVALSGRGICMNATDFCGQAELYLSENFNVESLGIILTGGMSDKSTRIKFDKEGFKQLVIGASYKFPSTMTDLSGNSLVGTLTASTDKSWADWIGELSVPAFKIGSFADIQFGETGKQTTLYFDHSDVRRIASPIMPSSFESGDNSDAPIIIDNGWTGIFIPEIAISLPGPIKNVNGAKLTVKAQNLIFHEGISGKVSLNNILSLGDGSLDGWYVSVDQFALNFWKNSLKSSKMIGKLVLPASGADYAKNINQIDYTCTLTKPNGGDLAFEMVAQPKSGLEFSALWTTVNIDKASNIHVIANGQNAFMAQATLHGSMVFKTDIKNLPDLTLGTLTFQNMVLRSQEEPSYFEPGQIQFGMGGNNMVQQQVDPMYQYAFNTKGPNADIDNYVAAADDSGGSVIGFSITETSIKPYINGTNVGFSFGGTLQLVKGVSFIPKAKFGISVYGDVGQVVNGRKAWQSVRGKLDSVELSANAKLGPVEVKGSLFYQDIQDGGIIDRGLAARISAKLPALGAGIAMQALFGSRTISGNATPANNRKFNYFYMDASLDLPTPGITMFPGTALYGFAGGFYYNMEAVLPDMSNKVEIKSMGSDNTSKDEPGKVSITSFSGTKYVPQGAGVAGSTFGIKAGVYFGLAKRSTLEGLLSLDISLNTSSGFNHFNLNGKLAVMTGAQSDFMDRYKNAIASGNMDILIQMADGEFDNFSTSASISIKYPNSSPIISAENNSFAFSINKNKEWYFHMGTPKSPNKIMFANFLASEAYFQVGTQIEEMGPLPDRVLELLGRGNSKASSEEGSAFNNSDVKPVMISGRNAEQMRTGAGFNFGAKIELEASPKFAIFYLDLYAALGFDFQLSKLTKANEACSQNVGDWYALGRAYMGAEAGCGVNINIFGLKKKIEFVRAGLAAKLTVGAPSPTFLKGTLGGRYSVLDGLIAGQFSIPFKIGEECTSVADRELKLISDIKPGGSDVSTLARPSVAFNFPLNRDFVVPITDEDNVKYEVYRFRPSYVTIDVKKNNTSVYTQKNFSAADENGLFSSLEEKYYPVYMLSLNDNASILEPLSTYKVSAKANLKILTSSLFGDWSRSQAHQAVEIGNHENSFQYVTKNNSNVIYQDVADTTFVTDNGPKNIPLQLVQDIMPIHRHNSLPYDVLPGKGYLRLTRQLSIPKSFNTNLVDAKAYARIVSMNGASEVSVQDLPVTIESDGKTWAFPKPSLLPNQKYVIKFIMKGRSDKSSDDKSGTKLVTKESFGNRGESKLNNREIIANALAMGPNEQELFSWYFNTGSFRNYTEKLNKLSLEKLTVNGNVIDVNTPEVNLANYKDVEGVMALAVTYQFYGNEYFNKLDYGTWKVGNVFPTEGNSNGNHVLSNKSYLTYLSDTYTRLPEMDRIIEEFMQKAFKGEKILNIGNVVMPWNAITGGLELSESNSFINPSNLLTAGLYGINYSQNNYGMNVPLQLDEQDQEAKEFTMLNTIFFNSNVKANIPTSSGAMLLAGIKKHVYTTTINSKTTSGKGALNGANMVLERINSVKNLGYPADIVSNIGVMIDQISNISSKAGSVKPTNVGKQKTPVVVVK